MQEPLAVDFNSHLSEQAFQLAGKGFSAWARSMSFTAFLGLAGWPTTSEVGDANALPIRVSHG